MTTNASPILDILALGLLAIGAFGLLTRRRVIQQVIALSIMLQGAIVALIQAGGTQRCIALVQGMIVSSLLVETVALAIILALIVNVYRHHPDGHVDDLDKLRG